LITTHFHPDHIGLTGWLSERFELPLPISLTTHPSCLNIPLSPAALDTKRYRDFYALRAEDFERTSWHKAAVWYRVLLHRTTFLLKIRVIWLASVALPP